MGCTAAHVQPMQAEVIHRKAEGDAVKGKRAPPKEEGNAWRERQTDPWAEEEGTPKRSKSVGTDCYPEVVVISGGDAVQPRCMGVFTISAIAPTSQHDWRPLYRNQRDKFLYYCAAKKMWLVGSSFNDQEGQLMSCADVQFPHESSSWKASKGSRSLAHTVHRQDNALATKGSACTIQVIGRGGGLLQRNEDGIVIGDWVCVEKNGTGSHRFREGDRGRVVGMSDERECQVEFEGRYDEGSIPVATWLLRILPEDMSTDGRQFAKVNLN